MPAQKTPSSRNAFVMAALNRPERINMKIEQDEEGECFVKVDTEFGIRHLPLNTKDREEARKRAAGAQLDEMDRLKTPEVIAANYFSLKSIGRTVTVAEAIKEWEQSCKEDMALAPSSIWRYAHSVKSWVTFIRKRSSSPGDLMLADINQFLHREHNVSINTRRIDRKAIKCFMGWLHDHGFIPLDPMRRVKKVHARYLTQSQCIQKERLLFSNEEYRRLMETVHEHADSIKERMDKIQGPWRGKERWQRMAAMLERAEFWKYACPLSRYGGFRIGDICRMEWTTLKSVPGSIVMPTLKSGKVVVVPLALFSSRELEATVRSIPENNSRYVFPVYQKMYADTKNAHWVYDKFKEHVFRAKLDRRHKVHDLRATFIKDCVDRNIPVSRVAEIVGHSRTRTTWDYIPLNEQPLLPEGVHYVEAQEVVEAQGPDETSTA